MTRAEIVLKAFNKQITWIQAAQILGVSDRQMRRLKQNYERHGFGCFRDYPEGRVKRKCIKGEQIELISKLRKQEGFSEMNLRHFWEVATERYGLKLSYNWTRVVLQQAGLADKAEGRGKYFRKRERKPMRGMMLHIDASTHEWIAGLPKWDLMLVLDDATSEPLYGKFVPEENVRASLEAIVHVLKTKGRFCSIYHDRGSHFGHTSVAGQMPDEEQNGPVPQLLENLGIEQIFARTPQARGRSERAWQTIQGRLPQELKVEGITSYEAANRYLKDRFLTSFSRKFAVEPMQKESAFVPLIGVNLELLAAPQSKRRVNPDNTVSFQNLSLQLPKFQDRAHLCRYRVIVHELLDDTLAISLHGKELARFERTGKRLGHSLTALAA